MNVLTLLRAAVCAALIFTITNCVSSMSRTELSTDINYQRDLEFEVESWDSKKKDWVARQKFVGVGVYSITASKYRVKVFAIGKTDMLVMTTCHRELKTASPDMDGSWFNKKGAVFIYEPQPEFEINRACPLDIGVYEKKKGRHGWAMLVLPSERENLHATWTCNGERLIYGGTSVCQAKAGLVQSIKFDRPVVQTKVPGCILVEPKDGMNWVFPMPEGDCAIFFFDKMDERNVHQAILFGYGSIPIRGTE